MRTLRRDLLVALALLAAVAAAAAAAHRWRDITWRSHYDAGWVAIRAGDLQAAAAELLLALEAAEQLGGTPLAETLDDLGLVYFHLDDLHRAEAMQGRAVAEELLQAGPDDPLLSTFIARLGIIYGHQDREGDLASLQHYPWKIFEKRYAPETRALAVRVRALAELYAGRGDTVAAGRLREQAAEIDRQAGT